MTTEACSWCGKPAVGHVVVEPARYRVDPHTGIRVVARVALTAPACGRHIHILEMQKDRK